MASYIEITVKILAEKAYFPIGTGFEQIGS